MGSLALEILAGTSLSLVALVHAAQRRLLARRAPACDRPLPAVSVLKPLCGSDPGLEASLETMFVQDHPDYEVILGAADADDPALDVARRVASRHSHVPCRIVSDARTVGLNPKVNNLANLVRHARHGVLLVSDSNVAAPRDHVRSMAARLVEPGVGLVSAPIRGISGGSAGSVLEALQLNTFVMGGVAAMEEIVGGVCVVGKSMMLRRRELDAIGGFAHLSAYLAEDQVCGEEVHSLGRRVTVLGAPVDNVLGPITVRTFAARHLRWARLRRWITPGGYAGEILLNPVFLAAAAALALRTPDALLVFAAVVLGKSVLDAAGERRLGVRRPLALYPLLVAAKDLITGALWIVPFLGRRVAWRGKAFELGPRTHLRPAGQREPLRAPELLPDAPPLAAG